MTRILWIVAVILIGLWLIGLFARVAGGLIHILLILALAIFLYNLIVGRRSV